MMGQKGSRIIGDNILDGRKMRSCDSKHCRYDKASKKLEHGDSKSNDELKKSSLTRTSGSDTYRLEGCSKQLQAGDAATKSGSRDDLNQCEEYCKSATNGNVNETHNNYVSGSSYGRPNSDSTEHAPVHGHNPFMVRAAGGKIQSLPRGIFTPIFMSQLIKVSHLRMSIDKRQTIIDERSTAVLKYRTPHFRASATVDVPCLGASDNLQIGWIQVCTDMHFMNLYGHEGLTSWEFPEIVSGKYRMISDADGKQYPWYGSKDEVQTLRGPTNGPVQVNLNMNDNFFPQVTWYIPHTNYIRYPKLTNIYRNQHFYAFLTIRDLDTHKFRVLKAVSWSMQLAIEVNPSLPLGKRARLLGPYEQIQPRVLDDDTACRLLENYALNPPNANNAQVLIWRPRFGLPKVIVPPVQTTIDMNQYLASTESYSKILEQIATKVFGHVR